ncbi:MAG: hypothetical protein ACD_62C00120G0007 [uncultured bacterium]|nr:MAG: hypothetical protein ACD_62C00120G0007 [uncultured bacterium]
MQTLVIFSSKMTIVSKLLKNEPQILAKYRQFIISET